MASPFKVPLKIPRLGFLKRQPENFNSDDLGYFSRNNSQERSTSSQLTNSSLYSHEEFEESFSQSDMDDSQCFWESLERLWKPEDPSNDKQSGETAAQTELRIIVKDIEDAVDSIKRSLSEMCNKRQLLTSDLKKFMEDQRVKSFTESLREVERRARLLSESLVLNLKKCEALANSQRTVHLLAEDLLMEFGSKRVAELQRSISPINNTAISPILGKFADQWLRKRAVIKLEEPEISFFRQPIGVPKNVAGSRDRSAAPADKMPQSTEKSTAQGALSLRMIFQKTPLAEARRRNLRSCFSRRRPVTPSLQKIPMKVEETDTLIISSDSSSEEEEDEGGRNALKLRTAFAPGHPDEFTDSDDSVSISNLSDYG
ncbi:unnamed protein product [Calicophoron daubneyi]|uniref:Uncharacterized protein n=1 Tax=Calicophoron daubneyi TaxID=300641 RepID=A0AAV2TTR7_CALDB